MSVANQVAEWLDSLPNVTGVRPCVVTLGKEKFEGASYVSRLQYSASMDVVRRGERKEGEACYRRNIYLVGSLPRDKKRGLKVCFPYEGQDWYVTCYYQGSDNPAEEERVKEYHPFGHTFVLGPWDVPDGSAIDDGERKPYRRVSMTIDFLKVGAA